jgi:hypothetical protein
VAEDFTFAAASIMADDVAGVGFSTRDAVDALTFSSLVLATSPGFALALCLRCAAACGRSPVSRRRLAALRGGIKTVLIPEENAKDLMEISESIKKGLEIVPVSRMDEVLARAMTRKPEPIEWDETTTAAASEATPVEEEASTLTAH